MAAPVPFALERALHAVVGACYQEILAARLEVAEVREAAGEAIAELEAKIQRLERELAQRDSTREHARENVAAYRAKRAPVVEDWQPPPLVATAAVPVVVRMATEAELATPPQNPRLTGLSTLVGLTFGTWLVLARGMSAGAGRTYWKCKCIKCGALKELAALGAYGLRGNRVAWCVACRAARKGAKKPVAPGDDDDEEASE